MPPRTPQAGSGGKATTSGKTIRLIGELRRSAGIWGAGNECSARSFAPTPSRRSARAVIERLRRLGDDAMARVELDRSDEEPVVRGDGGSRLGMRRGTATVGANAFPLTPPFFVAIDLFPIGPTQPK